MAVRVGPIMRRRKYPELINNLPRDADSCWPQECNSEYQEMVADKCLHCNKGVRKAGDFSGTFYPIDRKLGEAEGEEGELKVHMECWEAYEAKIAAEREGTA